jgi:hypothetical protein
MDVYRRGFSTKWAQYDLNSTTMLPRSRFCRAKKLAALYLELANEFPIVAVDQDDRKHYSGFMKVIGKKTDFR